MPSVRGYKPRITWGASFVNTLTFGYPLDTPVAGPLPREGSEWVQLASGVEDASLAGHDETLSGDVRWVPTESTVTPAATGWDGVAGWAAFLQWARAKNVFRFYPNTAVESYYPCYLVEPMTALPTPERDGRRRFTLVLRTSDGDAFEGY